MHEAKFAYERFHGVSVGGQAGKISKEIVQDLAYADLVLAVLLTTTRTFGMS